MHRLDERESGSHRESKKNRRTRKRGKNGRKERLNSYRRERRLSSSWINADVGEKRTKRGRVRGTKLGVGKKPGVRGKRRGEGREGKGREEKGRNGDRSSPAGWTIAAPRSVADKQIAN